MQPLKFVDKIFSFEDARPKNLAFFKNVKTTIFIFEYFPKMPSSEMNFMHRFYPILIPNTSHVKKNIYLTRFPRCSSGSQKSKKK